MKKKMKQTGEIIKKICQADDFTLKIYRTKNHFTRFAQNAITQHIDGENVEIQLDVAFDNKTGSASVNQYDDENLTMLVEKTESIAKLNKADPEFVASEGKHNLRQPDDPPQPTVNLKAAEMVDDIRKCINNAQKKEAQVSGISERYITENYMLTRNGFEGYDQEAHFAHSMTMRKGNVETKVSSSINDHASFSMDNMIQQLNSQFDSLQEPQKIDKGKIPVIMRPQAVIEWVSYLIWMYQLREADEGINPYTNQIGKQFFGKNFTLRSSVNNPLIHAPLFNRHGIPTTNIDWIVKGIINNMQTDRYYAQKKGVKPCSVFNIDIEGGKTSEQEMMKQVDHGIILNNLWYIRPIDAKKGEWTGLTRDGVLYFEKGKVRNAVVNLRWNEILHDATKRIISLGESLPIRYNALVPTMLIDGFNFVDVTTF